MDHNNSDGGNDDTGPVSSELVYDCPPTQDTSLAEAPRGKETGRPSFGEKIYSGFSSLLTASQCARSMLNQSSNMNQQQQFQCPSPEGCSNFEQTFPCCDNIPVECCKIPVNCCQVEEKCPEIESCDPAPSSKCLQVTNRSSECLITDFLKPKPERPRECSRERLPDNLFVGTNRSVEKKPPKCTVEKKKQPKCKVMSDEITQVTSTELLNTVCEPNPCIEAEFVCATPANVCSSKQDKNRKCAELDEVTQVKSAEIRKALQEITCCQLDQLSSVTLSELCQALDKPNYKDCNSSSPCSPPPVCQMNEISCECETLNKRRDSKVHFDDSCLSKTKYFKCGEPDPCLDSCKDTCRSEVDDCKDDDEVFDDCVDYDDDDDCCEQITIEKPRKMQPAMSCPAPPCDKEQCTKPTCNQQNKELKCLCAYALIDKLICKYKKKKNDALVTAEDMETLCTAQSIIRREMQAYYLSNELVCRLTEDKKRKSLYAYALITNLITKYKRNTNIMPADVDSLQRAWNLLQKEIQADYEKATQECDVPDGKERRWNLYACALVGNLICQYKEKKIKVACPDDLDTLIKAQGLIDQEIQANMFSPGKRSEFDCFFVKGSKQKKCLYAFAFIEICLKKHRQKECCKVTKLDMEVLKTAKDLLENNESESRGSVLIDSFVDCCATTSRSSLPCCDTSNYLADVQYKELPSANRAFGRTDAIFYKLNGDTRRNSSSSQFSSDNSVCKALKPSTGNKGARSKLVGPKRKKSTSMSKYGSDNCVSTVKKLKKCKLQDPETERLLKCYCDEMSIQSISPSRLENESVTDDLYCLTEWMKRRCSQAAERAEQLFQRASCLAADKPVPQQDCCLERNLKVTRQRSDSSRLSRRNSLWDDEPLICSSCERSSSTDSIDMRKNRSEQSLGGSKCCGLKESYLEANAKRNKVKLNYLNIVGCNTDKTTDHCNMSNNEVLENEIIKLQRENSFLRTENEWYQQEFQRATLYIQNLEADLRKVQYKKRCSSRDSSRNNNTPSDEPNNLRMRIPSISRPLSRINNIMDNLCLVESNHVCGDAQEYSDSDLNSSRSSSQLHYGSDIQETIVKEQVKHDSVSKTDAKQNQVNETNKIFPRQITTNPLCFNDAEHQMKRLRNDIKGPSKLKIERQTQTYANIRGDEPERLVIRSLSCDHNNAKSQCGDQQQADIAKLNSFLCHRNLNQDSVGNVCKTGLLSSNCNEQSHNGLEDRLIKLTRHMEELKDKLKQKTLEVERQSNDVIQLKQEVESRDLMLTKSVAELLQTEVLDSELLNIVKECIEEVEEEGKNVLDDSTMTEKGDVRGLEQEYLQQKDLLQKMNVVLDSLTENNQDLLQQCRKLNDALVDEHAQVSKLTDVNTKTDLMLQTLEKENSCLKEVKAELERHIMAQEAAVNHFDRKLNELGQKYEEKCQEFSDYENETTIELITARHQLEEKDKEIEELKQTTECQKQENNSLQDQLERLEEESQETMEHLAKDIDKYEKHCQLLNEAISVNKHSIEHLTKELTNKTKHFQQLQQEDKDNRKTIDELSQQLDKHITDLNIVSGSSESLSQEKTQLEKEMQGLVTDKAHLQIKLSGLEKDLCREQAEVQQKAREIEELCRALDITDMKHKNTENEVHKKENRIIALETELKYYMKEFTALEEEKTELAIRVNTLSEEICTSEGVREKLAQNNEALTSQLKAAVQKEAAARKDALEQSNRAKDADTNYQNELSRHSKDLTSLREIKEELERFRVTVKETEDSCGEVKRKLKVAEETWKEKEKQLETERKCWYEREKVLKAEQQMLKERIDELQSQNNTFQNNLKKVSGLESMLTQEQTMNLIAKSQLQSLEDDNDRLRDNIKALKRTKMTQENIPKKKKVPTATLR